MLGHRTNLYSLRVKIFTSRFQTKRSDTPALIEAIRYGDPHAYDELVKRCYESVRTFCRSMINEQESDDLTQEAFLRAIKGNYAPSEIHNLEAFMIHVARCVCKDHIRQKEKLQRIHQSAEQNHAESSRDAEDWSFLDTQDLLNTLSEELREVITLIYILDFTYEDAATLCDVPIGTIKSRIARSKTQLLAHLTKSDGCKDAITSA